MCLLCLLLVKLIFRITKMISFLHCHQFHSETMASEDESDDEEVVHDDEQSHL